MNQYRSIIKQCFKDKMSHSLPLALSCIKAKSSEYQNRFNIDEYINDKINSFNEETDKHLIKIISSATRTHMEKAQKITFEEYLEPSIIAFFPKIEIKTSDISVFIEAFYKYISTNLFEDYFLLDESDKLNSSILLKLTDTHRMINKTCLKENSSILELTKLLKKIDFKKINIDIYFLELKKHLVENKNHSEYKNITIFPFNENEIIVDHFEFCEYLKGL